MLLSIEQDDNRLTVSYYDKEGETAYKIYDLNQFKNWYVCHDGDRYKSDIYTNWDGRPVKQANAKFLNKHSIIDFLQTLPQEDKDLIFAHNYPKMYFMDIEVEVTDGFPEAKKAENRIITVSIATPDKEIIILGLKDLSPNEITNIEIDIHNHFLKVTDDTWKLKYIKFNSEYDMVYTLLTKYISKLPIISGWNFISYDWTYIINRCYRLQINPDIASPSLKLEGADNTPMHVGIVDYMRLYHQYDRTVKVKESSTLAHVSNIVLGVSKVKNNMNLKLLYEQKYAQYVFYNAVDSILVHMLDQKLKLADVLYTVASMTKSTLYRASSPVTITESLLLPLFKQNNKVLARDNAEKQKKIKYTGAYVKAPKVGFHKGVACFDFASLYPSMMRQFNISPENLKNKVPPVAVEKTKNESNIVTINGCVFDKEDSYLRMILTALYAKRKEYKGKAFNAKLKMEKIKKQLKEIK